MNSLWLLIVPFAATAGYINSLKKQNKIASWRDCFKTHKKPADYLSSLKKLVSAEPDKAMDLLESNQHFDKAMIETHLAIGALFRKQGEVNRAIRVHQHLLQHGQLTMTLRQQVLLALAKDYMSAGVLDRAEQVFLQLLDSDKNEQASYDSLITIYEQEKEWQKAIELSKRLAANVGVNKQREIAHYYSELAEVALKKNKLDAAVSLYEKALVTNANCVRASLGLAEVAKRRSNWSLAIKFLSNVQRQDSAWVLLSLNASLEAYAATENMEGFITYWQGLLEQQANLPVTTVLAEQIRYQQGDSAALEFVKACASHYPSLAALRDGLLLQKQLGNQHVDFEWLTPLVETLLDEQQGYHCVNCGFSGQVVHWQCPSCKQWEVVKPAYLVSPEKLNKWFER